MTWLDRIIETISPRAAYINNRVFVFLGLRAADQNVIIIEFHESNLRFYCGFHDHPDVSAGRFRPTPPGHHQVDFIS